MGGRGCTAIWAAARPGSTWPPSARWPKCSSPDRTRRILDSAHDLSDGGLAQALVESCLRHGVGARVELPLELDPFVALFSETAARAIVTTFGGMEGALVELCTAHGVPLRRIGVTKGIGAEAALEVRDALRVSLTDLRAAWTSTLPNTLE